MKILKYSINKNTNLANWLILASIILIFLAACTTPQSVGYNLKLKKNTKNKTNTSSLDTAEVTIAQLNEQNADQITFNDRLPTLREQMKIIADKQAEIEVDVDIIKSEIGLIKAEIVELKSTLLNNGKIEQKQIVAGEPSTKPKRIPQKQIEEETFILPDEAVQNETKKKESNTNKPIIIKPSRKNEIKPQSSNNRDNTEILAHNTKETKIADEIEKNNSPSNSKIKDSELYEKVKLAESLANSGKIKEARHIYQEIIKQNPKSELTPIAKKMLQQL